MVHILNSILRDPKQMEVWLEELDQKVKLKHYSLANFSLLVGLSLAKRHLNWMPKLNCAC